MRGCGSAAAVPAFSGLPRGRPPRHARGTSSTPASSCKRSGDRECWPAPPGTTTTLQANSVVLAQACHLGGWGRWCGYVGAGQHSRSPWRLRARTVLMPRRWH